MSIEFPFGMTGFKRFSQSRSPNCSFFHVASRDSLVGIETRYGLDGPGIESWWGWDFPHLSRPALGPIKLPIQWVPCLSWGWRRPGRDVDQLLLLEPRLKRVEVYHYSPSGPSWHVLGWTVPLHLPFHVVSSIQLHVINSVKSGSNDVN